MGLGPLIIDLAGETLSSAEASLLKHPAIGGVIFFSKNYKSPHQLMELTRQIRAVRPELLLTVDQEGGRVQRFKQGLTRLPAARQLASCHLKQVEAMGSLMGLELRALGVHLSFAPVLDLDRHHDTVIGDRAFSADPEIVAKLSGALMAGMRQAHLLSVGKHFPGHGAVEADSHLTLPIDRRDFNAIERDDLLPFKRLIKRGLKLIMTAHIVYPSVDTLPVTFSSIWLQKILRSKLGFSGLIVSDDLAMVGAAGMGSYSERVDAALKAGCDFVLLCHQREALYEVLTFLEQSSLENKMNNARMNDVLSLYRMPPLLTWDELEHSLFYQTCKTEVESIKLV